VWVCCQRPAARPTALPSLPALSASSRVFCGQRPLVHAARLGFYEQLSNGPAGVSCCSGASRAAGGIIPRSRTHRAARRTRTPRTFSIYLLSALRSTCTAGPVVLAGSRHLLRSYAPHLGRQPCCAPTEKWAALRQPARPGVSGQLRQHQPTNALTAGRPAPARAPQCRSPEARRDLLGRIACELTDLQRLPTASSMFASAS
jgi:hypothetical protein